jgi:4-hydroxy-2-oxoheptanedioate aldolase
MTEHSTLLEKLRRDELVVGMNVRHSRTSEAAPLLKECGFDWFMLDDEHTPFSPPQAYETLLAASRLGITGLVRARHNHPAEIGVHLSNAAGGIFIPHVDTAEQALEAAKACRFPPEGVLSVPGYFPQFGYQPIAFDIAKQRLNAETVVICMIESPESVSNIEAIAATSGVDVLFIGASDLTFAAGIHGQYDHPIIVDAVQRICAAAKANGKHVGLGGVKAPEQWKRYIGMGVRMAMTESDLVMLVHHATERARVFKAYLGA